MEIDEEAGEKSENIKKMEKEGPVIKMYSEKKITNENHMDKEVKPITSPYEKKK